MATAFDPTADIQDTDNFDAAMKIRYAAALESILQRRTVLLGRVEKTKQYWTGKHHLTPVQITSGFAAGARPESVGKIPKARAISDANSIITNKSHYCTVKVTGQADAQSSKGGAWASVKSRQIMNSAKDLRVTMNRALYGDGIGLLGEVSTTAVTGAGTVASPWIVELKGYNVGQTVSTDAVSWRTARHFKRGMWIVWGYYDPSNTNGQTGNHFDQTNPTGAEYGYVKKVVGAGSDFLSVQIVNNTELAGGTAPAAHMVFVQGDNTVYGEHSFNQECMGLRGIVSEDTENFQQVVNSDHPEWVGIEMDNPSSAGTPRQITDTLLQEACDRVYDLTAGEVDVLIMHTTTRNAYIQYLKSKGLERFAATKLKGGWSVLSYNGGRGNIDLYADKDCPYREAYALTSKYLKLFCVRSFAWDTTGGSVWKWPSDEDAAIAFGKTYCNLGTVNRTGHVRIKDISIPAVYA